MVEDNPDHADLIGGALEDADHHVIYVSSAPAAREAVGRGGHDLMLLDYTLGVETGFDVLRHAREVRPDLPVVVLTGRDDEELVLEAMQLGAADFLVKSFDRSFMRVLPLYVSKNLERSRLALALVDSEAARQRSEAYLRLLMDSLDAAVLGVDEMFQVTDSNAAWTALAGSLGADATDPVGRRLDDLLGPGPLTAVLNEQRTALALGEDDVLRASATVSSVELEVEATPLVAADRGDGVVFVLTDVTERNRARREEAALTVRLAEANEELDRLAQARGSLVTGVSRELRSPAQSIGGFAKMLASGALGALPAKAVQAAEVVGRGAERLGQLAEDLNYLATPAGEGLPPADPAHIVEAALALGADDRRARKIRVRRAWADELPAIRADRPRLTSALALLIADVADDARDRSSLVVQIVAPSPGDPDDGLVAVKIEAEGAVGKGSADLRMVVAQETLRRHDAGLTATDGGTGGRGGWKLTLPKA